MTSGSTTVSSRGRGDGRVSGSGLRRWCAYQPSVGSWSPHFTGLDSAAGGGQKPLSGDMGRGASFGSDNPRVISQFPGGWFHQEGLPGGEAVGSLFKGSPTPGQPAAFRQRPQHHGVVGERRDLGTMPSGLPFELLRQYHPGVRPSAPCYVPVNRRSRPANFVGNGPNG